MYRETYKETFREIFDRATNFQSGRRPIKIELEGILVPCIKSINEKRFRHKLESTSREYFLSMNETLKSLAKKIEWEEVIVKGHLNPNADIVEVENICRSKKNQPPRPLMSAQSSYFDMERLKRNIERDGSLELASDCLAI